MFLSSARALPSTDTAVPPLTTLDVISRFSCIRSFGTRAPGALPVRALQHAF